VLAVVIPERLAPQQKAEFKSFEKRKWMPLVLNLPSGLIQLPYVILNPSKEEWVPAGMDVMTWRAITWPLVGVLFWWSAGRGFDALLAMRRGLIHPAISWIETIFGTILFLFCATAAVCFPIFDNNVRDPDFPVRLFAWGFGWWALFAGALVTARFRQWRMRKKTSIP
jgi:hypothetical protein